LSGVMRGLSPGTRLPNLKFLPSAVLELFAFKDPQFTGSRDRDHAHFSEIFVGVMWGLSLGTGLPNLKFVPSAVLELLAVKAPKVTGSRDRDHAHFSEIFVRGHLGTILGNSQSVSAARNRLWVVAPSMLRAHASAAVSPVSRTI